MIHILLGAVLVGKLAGLAVLVGKWVVAVGSSAVMFGFVDKKVVVVGSFVELVGNLVVLVVGKKVDIVDSFAVVLADRWVVLVGRLNEVVGKLELVLLEFPLDGTLKLPQLVLVLDRLSAGVGRVGVGLVCFLLFDILQ